MIEYRKLTTKELDTFIDMRIHQLREEGAIESIDLKPALYEYYVKHILDGTFVSWLAIDKQIIIRTSGISFVEKPPYFGCISGKIGLLSSMYTDKNYRRKGIAKQLLSKVVDEAKKRGWKESFCYYKQWGVKKKSGQGHKPVVPLRFSKIGNTEVEKQYATHFVDADKVKQLKTTE